MELSSTEGWDPVTGESLFRNGITVEFENLTHHRRRYAKYGAVASKVPCLALMRSSRARNRYLRLLSEPILAVVTAPHSFVLHSFFSVTCSVYSNPYHNSNTMSSLVL